MQTFWSNDVSDDLTASEAQQWGMPFWITNPYVLAADRFDLE